MQKIKESIHIKNFGPIRDAEIKDIKKITVLIGDSGSGKSTIMKILVLFQWLYKQLCLRSYLKKAGVQEKIREFDFKEYLGNNGMLDYLNDNSEIIYARGKYAISYKNKKLNTRIEIDKNDLSLEKMSYISDKRNLIPDLYTSKISSNRMTDFYLQETFEDFKLAVENLETNILIPSINVAIEKKKLKYGKSDLHVMPFDGAVPYEVKIEDSSSGMQNVIPMYLIIKYFADQFNMAESSKLTLKKYMFNSDIIEQFSPTFNLADISQNNIHIHIEEPELSLYPNGQLQLLENLVEICKNNGKKNISMIFSTHSPYILNYLNLIIKKNIAEFEDIAAYQVHEGCLFSLMRENNHIVDTRSLSDPIARIYEEYNLQK